VTFSSFFLFFVVTDRRRDETSDQTNHQQETRKRNECEGAKERKGNLTKRSASSSCVWMLSVAEISDSSTHTTHASSLSEDMAVEEEKRENRVSVIFTLS
jgi:hypothetical protein